MLKVISPAGLAASSSEIVVADHQRRRDIFTGHTARERNASNREIVSVGSGLCTHPNSMGGNSGPAIHRIPPIIMPPLTTTCATTTTGEYSPSSPRLYPSPYSPAGLPFYSQNIASTSSAVPVPPPPSHPLHHPSSPAAASSAHYYYSYTNPYSRQYIQFEPNYSAALAANLQNPSATAQIRPFPRTAPIFTVSTGNPSTSPSPAPYNVFSFPPPHHLSLHPPSMTAFSASAAASSASSASEHSGLPLFPAPNNSPARLTSYSPDDRSPSSISPHSQISHHSSSPGVISVGNLKNGSAAVGATHSSSTSSLSVSFSSTANIHHVRSSSSSSGGSGGGRDLSLKHRLLVRPNQQAHSQDQQRQHTRNVSHLPTTSLPSSHVNIDHVVNKLRSSTPKRSKSSSTSSSSTISSTSRPPSSQPPTTPSAVPVTHGNSTTGHLSSSSSKSVGNGKLMHPPHFHKGSVIELSDGGLKYVENLCVEDFLRSADLSSNLEIDSSKVVKIEPADNPENNEAIVKLGFSVGKQQLQVSVEAAVEHPFFVYGKGWSSCCPKMSLHRYALECHQLTVGDVCISLTHRKSHQRNGRKNASAPNSSTIAVNGISDNKTIATAAVTAVNSVNINVGTKTSYLRGTSAKRKRRWSESDAAECQILPNSENKGSDIAAIGNLQTPLTKVENN
ncbi:hypothetical protein CHUAL_003895 [Chamberlinius hualienensis]